MLALKGGNILTLACDEGLGQITGGVILINEGVICRVGDADNVKIPPGTDIVDVTDRWILPGFTDPHTHLGIVEKGVQGEITDANEVTSPVTPQVRAIDAINPADEAFNDALKAGYTTVLCTPGSGNIVGGQSAVIKTRGSAVEDMVIDPAAGMKMALGGNPKRAADSNPHGKHPMTRMGIAAILRQALTDAQQYGHEDGRHLRLEALARVIDREFPARIHVGRSDDIFTIFRLADEFGFDFTLEHGTESHLLVDELCNRDVSCVLGPMFSARSPSELKNLTFRTPGILAGAGLTVALTADHPIIPIQFGIVQAAVAVKAGMTMEDALRAITINGAKIMGVEERIGSIQQGKDADLVVMTGHPFDLDSAVQCTLIEGEVVFQQC